MHFGSWLKTQIEEMTMNQTEFSVHSKINYWSLRNWLKSPLPKISGKNQVKLANSLGVSREELARQLKGTASSKIPVIENLPGKVISETKKNATDVDAPPAKLLHYACGVGKIAAGGLSEFVRMEYPGVVDDMIPVVSRGSEVFWFVVDGDSMSPRFANRDVVVCEVVKRNEVRNGEAYVFLCDGDGEDRAGFKLLSAHPKKKDTIVATPINSAFKSFEVKRDSVIQIGRAYMILPRMK